MPRSRGTDVVQRSSPRASRAPLHLKATACSEANSVHHRPAAADRSPKVSPRGVVQERKRGTRAGDLEIKLSKAQAELKKLREQLTSAEAAKLEMEQALAQAKKRVPAAAPASKGEEEKSPLSLDSQQEGVRQEEEKPEESVTSPATMDVFEVVVPTEPIHRENEIDNDQKQEEKVVKREEEETKTMIEKPETDQDNEAEVAEKEEECKRKEKSETVALPGSPEVTILKAKLLEKEKEVAILLEENVIFKTKAQEEAKQIAKAAQAKEEELITKLNSLEEKLKMSKAKEAELTMQLEAAEGTNVTLETEMNRLRVQTDQWRKAAEAAAAALGTGGGAGTDMGGRRMTDRSRSMDKHHGASYANWGSPLMEEDIDVDGGSRSGRRKGTGIRILGNLWKKNQHNLHSEIGTSGYKSVALCNHWSFIIFVIKVSKEHKICDWDEPRRDGSFSICFKANDSWGTRSTPSLHEPLSEVIASFCSILVFIGSIYFDGKGEERK
ncbi:interactor of constitutive active ROPs 4-like isoform X2 [Canna indica]|uniref:Interactor of constitutive active ROPs 4-like isoform X2 n=1 Tax=Canna indica TaxID=4628 RepID=A0AAQ3JWT2_9LILI|nr:interactor of constitutive active ROPs 4-like isoform X2 [Canna indica]